MALILQPYAHRLAQKNFQKTIKSMVNIDSSIRSFISQAEWETLAEFYPNMKAPVWGVMANTKNPSKWKKLKEEDVVLFSRNKEIQVQGIVTCKLHNEQLANHLWGQDSSGKTWEYIYFLDRVKEIPEPIKISQINGIMDYAQNYVIQAFTYLDNEKAHKVIDRFKLSEISKVDIEEIIDQEDNLRKCYEYSGLLNIATIANRRKEQVFLRKYLIKNSNAVKCEICGQNFPECMLVAGHIKKRQYCSIEECKDFDHIAMLVCKCGCDAFFEAGFVYVDDRGIVNIQDKGHCELREKLDPLQGRTCKKHTGKSKEYFKFHRSHIAKVENPVDK